MIPKTGGVVEETRRKGKTKVVVGCAIGHSGSVEKKRELYGGRMVYGGYGVRTVGKLMGGEDQRLG